MPRPLLARVALLGLLIALPACGGGKKQAATTTTTLVGGGASPTTTTTADLFSLPPGTSPLTGLPIANSAALRRPVLAVKLDNAPKARPQAGLNQADMVVEEKVEDGVTRFFTVFQSTDAPRLEPVRSARSTDISLAGSLNHPLFAYSGTNSTFQALVNKAPLVDVGIDHATAEYHRDAARPAPYNLVSDTASLWRHAPAGAGPPAPQFPFRRGGALTVASASPLTTLHITFQGLHITTNVDWHWDAPLGEFKRWMDGPPHLDAAGEQVTAKNIVVEFVDYTDTGIRDRSNTAVPEAQLIGSGDAWILTDGKIVRGHWSKPSLADVAKFTGPDGAVVPLTPGRTCIELSPKGASTAS